jgi:hypothetical protein
VQVLDQAGEKLVVRLEPFEDLLAGIAERRLHCRLAHP